MKECCGCAYSEVLRTCRGVLDASDTVAVLTAPALAGTMSAYVFVRELSTMPDKGPGSKGGGKKPKGGGKATAKSGKK